jgi:hypothetical protein
MKFIKPEYPFSDGMLSTVNQKTVDIMIDVCNNISARSLFEISFGLDISIRNYTLNIRLEQ